MIFPSSATAVKLVEIRADRQAEEGGNFLGSAFYNSTFRFIDLDSFPVEIRIGAFGYTGSLLARCCR
jgi:hypothetical protein